MTGVERVVWVDIAKGVSIVLVAIYHATLMTEGVGIDVELLSMINKAVAPIRMPLFFMASGFFARSSINAAWPALWRRRILFFVYLFAIWTILRWLFFAAISNPWTPTEGDDIAQIVTAFLVPQTGLWFLWELAWFYLLTKAVSRCPVWLVTAIASLASIVGFMQVVPLQFAYENFLRYFVFFYVACHYREIISGVLAFRRLLTLLTAGIAFVALVGAIYVVESRLFDGIGYFASAICGVVGLFIASGFMAANGLGTILAYFGRHTLPIYLAHVPLVALMAHGFAELEAERLGAAAIVLPLMAVAAAIPICLALEWAARRVGASWLYELPTLPSALRFGAASRAERTG